MPTMHEVIRACRVGHMMANNDVIWKVIGPRDMNIEWIKITVHVKVADNSMDRQKDRNTTNEQ